MIHTDHQYQVTAKAAGKFRAGIKELSQIPKKKIIDLKGHQYHIRAMQRQAEDLEAEMAEYELIKAGKVKIKVTSVSDLGINLVKARIKVGVDQATLAKHLKVSEDLIDYHETEFYSTVTIADIRKVAKIVDLDIPEEVIPSRFNGKISGILTKLKKAGLDRKFVLSRLVKPDTYKKVVEKSGVALEQHTLGLYKHVNHVFGWTWDDFTNSNDLTVPNANSASAKFKIESNRNPKKINVYSIYAHYLANVATKAGKSLVKKDIPANAIAMRKAIINSYGSINLENTLKYAWDCGIIIIPLNDKGKFHGVCIRVQGRNVIILNPRKLYVATWLFDLLHELSHAGQEPEKEFFDEIEEVVTSHERRTSKEELAANDFANTVIFGESANDLFNQCLERADGKLNLLKKAISAIAQENHVMVGALANYVAHESKADSNFKYKELLAMAESLQLEEGNPYKLAADIFMDRFPFDIWNGIDIGLLFQAFDDEYLT